MVRRTVVRSVIGISLLLQLLLVLVIYGLVRSCLLWCWWGSWNRFWRVINIKFFVDSGGYGLNFRAKFLFDLVQIEPNDVNKSLDNKRAKEFTCLPS